jgi:hypothetical protein
VKIHPKHSGRPAGFNQDTGGYLMMNRKLRTRLTVLTIIALALASPLFARITAAEVMQKVYERPNGENMQPFSAGSSQTGFVAL